MKRRKYDKAFKVSAVQQVLEEGKKVSHVAKALGILPTMLNRWGYEYQTHGEDALSGNGAPIRNADWEIQRLQKRLEELETENEILKKFQAYWKGVERSSTDSSGKTHKPTK
ncbi:transposase [Alicyclobacillus kakegawensis]|uniref:transposase n=1 Tax=Alicyclobacillus kakegawensis TaxID=392012 RepID=UPI000ADA0666|nr:transposase [Alicyclobacillus kakegawensis]